MTMHMNLLTVNVDQKDLPYTQLADEVAVAVAGPPGSAAAAAAVAQRNSAIDRSKFKTKLCKNWVNGTECPYGARCVFAHGKQEKRDEGDLREVESSLSTPLESSLLARSEVLSWDPLEGSTGSMMNAAAPAYYPQVYQEVQYQEVHHVQQQQQQQVQQVQVQVVQHVMPPMQVVEHATCYRYEPYNCDVVTRVPVAVSIPLRRTATNESQGLTDVSSDY